MFSCLEWFNSFENLALLKIRGFLKSNRVALLLKSIFWRWTYFPIALTQKAQRYGAGKILDKKFKQKVPLLLVHKTQDRGYEGQVIRCVSWPPSLRAETSKTLKAERLQGIIWHGKFSFVQWITQQTLSPHVGPAPGQYVRRQYNRDQGKCLGTWTSISSFTIFNVSCFSVGIYFFALYSFYKLWIEI